MKSARVIRNATLLLVALAVFSANLAAQQTGHRHQHRYKLVEVDTFGGPNSCTKVLPALPGMTELSWVPQTHPILILTLPTASTTRASYYMPGNGAMAY